MLTPDGGDKGLDILTNQDYIYYVGANLCGGWLNVSFNVKQPINTKEGR